MARKGNQEREPGNSDQERDPGKVASKGRARREREGIGIRARERGQGREPGKVARKEPGKGGQNIELHVGSKTENGG